MPFLSVIMIVRNEEHCLGECLENVAAIANELVIGDTGSVDGTRDIAARYGARVLDTLWQEDFAAARNHVLAAASGDWLLHLDADEVLDPKGATRVRELVDADGRGADAIEVTLANYCDDPYAWRWTPVTPGDPWARGRSGYIKTELLRLFRNRRGFEYREPVHENITQSVIERGGVVRKEPVIIHHYGYRSGGRERSSKSRVYLAILRRKVEAYPNDPKAWHDLAEQLLACGDAPGAEQACRKALVLEPMDLNAATTLANLLLNRGELDAAHELLSRLDEAGIGPPHVLAALGAIACKRGRIEEARRRLEGALAATPDYLVARLYLARALDLLGLEAEAREQLTLASRAAPTLIEFQQRLEAHQLRKASVEHFRQGRTREALETFVTALRLDSEDPLIHNNLGVLLSSLGDATRAKECFERALRLAPGMSEAAENLRSLR
ncbi:MAG: glycosyltransferase [Candidatus Hydrogenedentes bacterium]|nr:glycosyltransferase [Candidatus Hydrogenedentota bacterium]